MTQYLVPTDQAFVEQVAKSIARDRMMRDASNAMKELIGINIQAFGKLEESFDRVFERLWAGSSPHDELQKDGYRQDAQAAIRAINLKLITATSE